ncbi:60S ribosomal protein L37a-like [Psammomys obesus]|uniref:60S ribosomal protein L37a-like n=1 Tax=Psammomys obesus TaxID=48139 RepID=UPI0024537356|nr:60S ribosomal protein L37a-like [Psammomys obesus]
MAKCTKKIGIVGKYGTRYGTSLQKMVKKIVISQHTKCTCSFCGKTRVKRFGRGYFSLWFQKFPTVMAYGSFQLEATAKNALSVLVPVHGSTGARDSPRAQRELVSPSESLADSPSTVRGNVEIAP